MIITHHIISCPQCGGLHKKLVIVSGNTLGMEVWSDGLSKAPMNPSIAKIRKCPHCEFLFWEHEENDLGEWLGDCPPEWNTAPFSYHISIQEWRKCIETKMYGSQEEELYLRLNYWFSYNDDFRDNPNFEPSPEQQVFQEKNIQELLDILPDKPIENRLMKAELQRQSGNFDACIRICESIRTEMDKNNYVLKFVDQIQEMAQKGQKVVFRLAYED